MIVLRKLVLSGVVVLGVAGTAIAAPFSSADGDVRVSSSRANIYDRSYVFVTVGCGAKTDTDTGCPAGQVVLLNGSKSVSTKGEFPALGNGASTWVRIKVGEAVLSSFTKSKKTVTMTARAEREASGAGLESKLRLSLR